MKATVFIFVTVLVMDWSGLHGQGLSRLRGRGEKQALTSKIDRFNFFDIELLKEVCSNPAGAGNVMVSPASVKAVLAMLLEGASGSSADQIKEALRYGESKEETQNHLSTFLQTLQGNRGASYNVEIANILFASKNLNIRPEYKRALKDHYGADVQQVNFNQPLDTATIINNWVNTSTHGLIPTLVDPEGLPSNTMMMFANALYFKGKWKESFDKDATMVRPFYTSGNDYRDSYMMESLTYYRYANIDALDARAIELPYEGDKFSMLVLLPNKVNGIKQLVRDLPQGFHESVLQSLESTEVLVMMPKFSIEYSTDLIGPLSNLLIKDVFGPQANLSGIVKEGTTRAYVSKVIHKTKIEVNEEGTTAAGSTGAVVVPLIGSTIPKFAADHPFLFFIRDMSSGGFLFGGRVSLPDPVQPDELSEIYLEVTAGKDPASTYRLGDPDTPGFKLDVGSNTRSGSSITREPGQYQQPAIWAQNQPQRDNVQFQPPYDGPSMYPINSMPQQSAPYIPTGINMRTANQQTPYMGVVYPNNNDHQ